MNTSRNVFTGQPEENGRIDMKTRTANSISLRSGYTTGTCAAAAAKAAALALCKQEAVSRIQIILPEGKIASFNLNSCNIEKNQTSCSVIKDAGDDPDITDGIEIYAQARWTSGTGTSLIGGTGVGIVTKPGLEVPIGMPAINPIPRQMILEAVSEVLAQSTNNRGIEITISVPGGRDLARKTLNPRLGIVGGISILGTTGIVIPYSINAYTACISQSVCIAVASGCKEVVLTTGRRSEKYAQQEIKLPEECFIQAGDYIDHSLHECAKKNITRVIVWGMIGKISKLAAGHLYTNVSDSLVDIKLLAGLASDCDIPREIVQAVKEAVTANHFRKLLPAQYLRIFCDKLCLLAAQKCRTATGNKVTVECIVTDPEGVIIGRANAKG
jgi:cobalt-precorrin-5B (C1)-methyltransferase